MTQAPPKLLKDKPWHKYRGRPNWKDLEPGYAGTLDDEQVAFIQEHLKADDALSYWWGWKPRARRRAIEAIRRVSMHGSPESRSHNVALVREAGRRLREGNEGGYPRVTKPLDVSPPRLGRPRIESWESEMLKLASSGLGVKRIAQQLQASGVSISHMTVARRLAELKAISY